ncbi:MAG TPA: methyltransferase domain-containing protein [Drouetiella sp.]|jgi:methyl halide transferase
MDSKKIPTVETVEFWEGLYQRNITPWELGTYSPPLKTFLDSPYRVPAGKVAVLGCGTGFDALLFAYYGYNVVAFDFAPSAVASTRAKLAQYGFLGKNAEVVQKDIFDLYSYRGAFDYVLEQTCFCAIHPARRKNYELMVRDVLKPDGKLIALWWLIDRQGAGPPFPVSKDELFELFSPHFRFDLVHQPTDSVPDRKGKELFALLSKY